MKYNFTLTRINITKVKVHPSVVALGYSYKPSDDNEANKVLQDDFNYFEKFYDRPVAIENGDEYLLLTHLKDFHLLKESGETEIEVYVGCFEDDYTVQRFIGLRNSVLKKDWRAQYEMATFLTEFLDTDEGKEYAKSIPHKKTREKVAYMMGTSDSSIQRVMAIGKEAPEYLDMITEGHISFTEANVAHKKQKYGGKKKDGEADKSKKKRKKEEEPKDPPNPPEIVTQIVDNFSFEMIDGVPVVKCNDHEYQSMSLVSSLEVIDGKGRIEFKDPRANGPEFVILTKNIYFGNTVDFQNKKSTNKTKKAA